MHVHACVWQKLYEMTHLSCKITGQINAQVTFAVQPIALPGNVSSAGH